MWCQCLFQGCRDFASRPVLAGTLMWVGLSGLSSDAFAGAAPPLERAFLNQPLDASNAPMPSWAWGPSITQLADGTLLVGFKGSEKVGGAVNVETSDASAIYFTRKAPDSNTWSAPMKAGFDTVAVAEGNIQLSTFGHEVWATYFGRPRPGNGNWTNGQFDATLYLRKSTDGGITWSHETILRAPGNPTDPASTQGTVNAANIIKLANGTFIAPFNNDDGGNAGGQFYGGVMRSSDGGNTWTEARIPQPATTAQTSMPTVQELTNGDLVAYLRTYGVNGDTAAQKLHRSISTDNGLTWSTPITLSNIKNPNSRVDALQLDTGEMALAGNDTVRLPGLDGATGRKEVNLLLTGDLGLSLIARKTLAMNYDGNPNGATNPEKVGTNEWGYPTLIQGNDGFVHVVYGSRNDKKQGELAQIVYAKVDRTWFDLPDPVLWFDASDVDNDSDPFNDPNDNTTLATWVDRTGQTSTGANKNASNPTNSTRPSFQVNEVDGKPVVRFDGTSNTAGDFLFTPSLTAETIAGPGRNEITIMAVLKQNDVNRGGVFASWQTTSTDPKNRVLIQNGQDGTDEVFRFDFQDDSDANRLVGTTNLSDGAFHILSAIMDGSRMRIFIDGELEASLNSSAVLASGNAGFYLGAVLQNAGVRAFGNFDLAELLVYDQALDFTAHQYTGYYLGHKYGIASTYEIPEPASLAIVGLLGTLLASRRRPPLARSK